MKTFYFNEDFICRYKQFLASDEYNNVSEHSKSQYWEYFAKKVGVEIKGNAVTVTGVSGFYIPSKRGVFDKVSKLTKKVLGDPAAVVKYVVNKVRPIKNAKKLISYGAAFDNVMNADVAQVDTKNEYSIDFKKVIEAKRSYVSIKDIKKRYKNSYSINDQIIYSHYIFNILNAYANLSTAKTVLEIGAGNGNLLSVLRSNDSKKKLIDIDLPETLSHAILYISDLFPKASIMMPNEVGIKKIKDCDVVFLTPSQIHLLEDNSVDVFINTFSFQEMTHKQIKEYFDLIQRCGKNNSHFFTSNRVEKTPSLKLDGGEVYNEPPNRFDDYPWNDCNEILAHEICKLMQQAQHNSICVRLEKIRK